MKHICTKIIYSILLLLICAIGIIGYILFNSTSNKINSIHEELITLKQLYEVQEDILNDNFSEKELDSLYLEYNYYYLHKYYQKNHP